MRSLLVLLICGVVAYAQVFGMDNLSIVRFLLLNYLTVSVDFTAEPIFKSTLKSTLQVVVKLNN